MVVVYKLLVPFYKRDEQFDAWKPIVWRKCLLINVFSLCPTSLFLVYDFCFI